MADNAQVNSEAVRLRKLMASNTGLGSPLFAASEQALPPLKLPTLDVEKIKELVRERQQGKQT